MCVAASPAEANRFKDRTKLQLVRRIYGDKGQFANDDELTFDDLSTAINMAKEYELAPSIINDIEHALCRLANTQVSCGYDRTYRLFYSPR
jgi:hypothetical protein